MQLKTFLTFTATNVPKSARDRLLVCAAVVPLSLVQLAMLSFSFFLIIANAHFRHGLRDRCLSFP